jgi:hypothetical protein
MRRNLMEIPARIFTTKYFEMYGAKIFPKPEKYSSFSLLLKNVNII